MENQVEIKHVFSERVPPEFIIRKGEAAKIYDPEQIKLEGIITAPSEYYRKRKELCDNKTTHVIFNKDQRTIKLVVEDWYKFQSVITGKLVKHKFLDSLHINSAQSYTIGDLLKVLRFAKRFFSNPTEHTPFILSLRNFTTKITQTTSKADDRNGNLKISVESKLEEFQKENKPMSFMLNLPVFYGTDPVNITINIELEALNGSVFLYLICEDLEQMEDEIVSGIFEKEEEVFSELAIIRQD